MSYLQFMTAASDPQNIAGALVTAAVAIIGKVLRDHISTRKAYERELRHQIAGLETRLNLLQCEVGEWQERYFDAVAKLYGVRLHPVRTGRRD
jgi:hypothetical protein